MPTLQQCWEAGITPDQILCIWSDGSFCTYDKLDPFEAETYEMYLGYVLGESDIERARKTFLKITR
jgi:hypothetical protein